jgi:hypothetical protein
MELSSYISALWLVDDQQEIPVDRNAYPRDGSSHASSQDDDRI